MFLKRQLKHSKSKEKHSTARFPLHFSRALAASCIKAEYIKTEQSAFKVSLVISHSHPWYISSARDGAPLQSILQFICRIIYSSIYFCTVYNTLWLNDLGIWWKCRPGHCCVSWLTLTNHGTFHPFSTNGLVGWCSFAGRALWLHRYCVFIRFEFVNNLSFEIVLLLSTQCKSLILV